MGKKKSKTSKQKQAKASAKSLKCRVVKEQPIIKANDNNTPSPFNKKKKSKGKRHSTANYCEKEDFQRQQASMQERQMAQEHQLKRMKKQRGKGGIKKHNNDLFQFQAPTLIVDDHKKSTSQLMTEITSKAQGWGGINNSMQPQTPGTIPQNSAISLKQVFQNSTLVKPEPIPKSKNPFAALENDSDDEEEAQKNEPASIFQFAPATFSIPTPTNAVANDVDPDL